MLASFILLRPGTLRTQWLWYLLSCICPSWSGYNHKSYAVPWMDWIIRVTMTAIWIYCMSSLPQTHTHTQHYLWCVCFICDPPDIVFLLLRLWECYRLRIYFLPLSLFFFFNFPAFQNTNKYLKTNTTKTFLHLWNTLQYYVCNVASRLVVLRQMVYGFLCAIFLLKSKREPFPSVFTSCNLVHSVYCPYWGVGMSHEGAFSYVASNAH